MFQRSLTKLMALCLSFGVLTPLTASADFDYNFYIEKCADQHSGSQKNIYPACDSEELNQVDILNAAVSEAKATGKPLYVIAGADWCPPCKVYAGAMEDEKALVEELKKEFIVVKFNTDAYSYQSVDDALNLNVRGIPSTFVIPDIKDITNHTQLYFVYNLGLIVSQAQSAHQQFLDSQPAQ